MKVCKLELLTSVYACVFNATKINDVVRDLTMIARRELIIHMKALQRQKLFGLDHECGVRRVFHDLWTLQ